MNKLAEALFHDQSKFLTCERRALRRSPVVTAAGAAGSPLLLWAAGTAMAILPSTGYVVAIPIGEGGAPSLAVIFRVNGAEVVSPPVVFEWEHAVGLGFRATDGHTASG